MNNIDLLQTVIQKTIKSKYPVFSGVEVTSERNAKRDYFYGEKDAHIIYNIFLMISEKDRENLQMDNDDINQWFYGVNQLVKDISKLIGVTNPVDVYIDTEPEHETLMEEEQKVLHIPSLKIFGGWDSLQGFLKSKGNPPYSIGEDLNLNNTQIESLGNLQSVGGDLYLKGTQIESLGNLQSVGGYLDLTGTPIKSLGNLQSVDGSLDLGNTPIKSLGNLQSVGGYLDLTGTQIESLGNLQSVDGSLDLNNTPIKSLGNLQSVVGYLDLTYTPIESLGNLQSVVGYLYLNGTQIESLGNLQSVDGDLYLKRTPIAKIYNRQQIRKMINVTGEIYM